MRLPKLSRRGPRPTPELWFPDVDDEEAARCGFVFTAYPAAPPMRLTEPITGRGGRLSVTPHVLASGQCYLLGTPGEPDCEVILVDPGQPVPGQPRRIRRAMFRTLTAVHPAGTQVTAVTVRFVADWAREES